LSGSQLKPPALPGVSDLIFETGLSYAYIGRENTVVVREENTKVISDLYGICDIIHDFSQNARIVATQLKKRYEQRKSQMDKLRADKFSQSNEQKLLDFSKADQELEQSGLSIRNNLERHMLDDQPEEFLDYLKRYVTEENSYIFAEDYHGIATLCISMWLYPHALKILEYAHERFPRHDDITLKLIETYTYADNPSNKSKAKKLMESHFFIARSESNIPGFTVESKSRHIAHGNNLQRIFKVYLMDYEYDNILNIIDSYEKLNVLARNNMIIDSDKAFSKWHKGDYEEAISLYKGLVSKYPNEDDMRNLGLMFFNTGEIEKGYQIYELIALAWFDCDALLRLSSKMADDRICRTERGLESTRASKHFAKRVIVPILFKAIDLSPNEDTIRRVKWTLRGIGGRDEFEFIQKNSHVPQEMFSILREERSKFYDWSNLEYIEANKINQNDISQLNDLLSERTLQIIREEQEVSLMAGEV